MRIWPASLTALLKRDTAALMMANLAGAVAGMVTGIIAARALGAEGRGDLAVLIFWPALIATLIDLGVPDAVTLRCAREPGAARTFHRNATILGVASGVIGALIGLVAVPFMLRESQAGLLPAARGALMIIPASSIAAVPVGTLLGLHRFRAVAAIRLAAVVLYTGSMLVAVALGHGTVQVLLWLTILSRLIPGLLAFPFVRRVVNEADDGVEHPSHFAAQAAEGTRLHASRLTSVLGGSEDRALASLMLTQAAIGLWQVASALIVVMQFVAQGVGQHLFSKVAAGRGRPGHLVYRAYVRAVALTGVVALLATPLLPLAIPMVYGRSFANAVVPGIVVMVGAVIAAGAATLLAGARAILRTAVCVQSEVAGMAVMATVAVLCVPRLGELGLAAAYVAGRAGVLAWMALASRPAFRIRPTSLLPGSRRFLRTARVELARGLRSPGDAAGVEVDPVHQVLPTPASGERRGTSL
jgi:O-antigen/teichoic acid export membrane protein